jgi:hypothetical protein
MSWLSKSNKIIQEKGKMLYTLLIYNHTSSNVISKLRTILEKVNLRMKDAFKKKLINERLYNIITELENLKPTDKINHIILSGKKVNIYDLSKEQLAICKKWNLSDFYYTYNEYFEIQYLKDLFCEKNARTIGEFTANTMKLIELDTVKDRIIEAINFSNQEEFKKYYDSNNLFLIHGTGSFIKKIKFIQDHKLFTKRLHLKDVNKTINKLIIEENQVILNKEVLSQLTNPVCNNLFLFGKKEVSQGIIGFLIKKLFITQKLLIKLKNKIDDSLLNFDIVIVNSLISGDIGDSFIRDYGGLIGVKYYT